MIKPNSKVDTLTGCLMTAVDKRFKQLDIQITTAEKDANGKIDDESMSKASHDLNSAMDTAMSLATMTDITLDLASHKSLHTKSLSLLSVSALGVIVSSKIFEAPNMEQLKTPTSKLSIAVRNLRDAREFVKTNQLELPADLCLGCNNNNNVTP